MPNALNRTTLRFKTSADPNYHPVVEWIIDPDMSNVEGVPKQYWKIVGDDVLEMSQAEKDAKDITLEAERVARLEYNAIDRMMVPDVAVISQELQDYINANAVYTDSVTGLKGPPVVVQMLNVDREVYGNPDNPLCPDGYEDNLVSRANNLETIHGDTGWHQRQVQQALFHRPKDLLIYYGYLNSFNSATNGWDNDKVAKEMAQYGLLVFGDGVEDSGHPDYANTTAIVAAIKQLNPNALIFGYASINQSQANFETKVDGWETLGVHGIFLDEAGYDYGTTTTNDRSAFNTKVDYVHAQSTAKICFANAWNADHILGTANDVSYPNTTWNSGDDESNLNTSDWILLESYPINTTSYTASTPDGYEPKADWASRGVKATGLRDTYGVNFAACGIINNDNADGQALFQFSFISACQFSLDGHGTSDTSYGSSTAAVKWWNRPDLSAITGIYSISPTVTADPEDADIYYRYIDGAKFVLDFSDSAQSSRIVKLIEPTPRTFSVTLESPTDSENVCMGYTELALTVKRIVGVVTGASTPSVTIQISHGADRSATGDNVLSAATAVTNTTTGQTMDSFDEPKIPANSWIVLKTTAQSGTVNELIVFLECEIDR